MSTIQILPAELINQIAAGEVVERPASVIKELVENAIDAGATRVDVSVSNGGRNLRVADNGHGMAEANLRLAFKNHATSKVKTVEDLFRLGTLGFRGEALASIAAIAKVTCLTRTAESVTGLKAQVSAAGEVVLQEAGCAQGTIFEVNDLFYNVPARFKFMKRPQTELAAIQEMVQMLALSHPEIAFQLRLEDAASTKTSGSGDLETAIGEVFSLSERENLLPFLFTDEITGYRVSGRTGPPHVTRGSKKWVLTFVNGRAVRCPILLKAIESSYQGLMTPGKFPISILFLDLPPDEVDVNVHPTKKEVKYAQANTLFSFVRRALDGALGGLAQQTAMPPQLIPPMPSVSPSYASYSSGAAAKVKPSVPRSHEENESLYKLYSSSSYDKASSNPSPTAPNETEPWLPQLPSHRIIGQFARTYILLESPEGLLVVDQHIAGERVLFERFSEQAERMQPASQALLIPLSLPISAFQRAYLVENKSAFETLGFTYQVSDITVEFSQVPSLYSERVLKSNLENLLADLDGFSDVYLSITDVIATTACHSAVRAGDTLSFEQMDRVIAQWLACTRPWTCPHGRPVSYTLPHTEIMAFFERPSLPQGVR